MDTIKVVCGIVHQNDHLLLCKRKAGKPLSGYWEFPGGKIEPNESEVDALRRELQEELAIQVKVKHHFKTIIHQYEHIQIELIAYHCTFIQGRFTLTDHDEIRWIKKAELLSYHLAPADIPIAKALVTSAS